MKTSIYRMLAVTALVAVTLVISGCSRSVSNVQTLISEDCGENWKLIPVGSAIPTGFGNPCFLQVTVPNYPMAGESNFRGTFDNNVRVSVNSSYDYTITEPLKFIERARFVSRQNSAGDDKANAASVWDTAENIIIDRFLRELANSPEYLLAQDIVDFNQGEFEDALLAKLNESLAERGVQLNTFTFVVTPDDQTRNMIDIAAALRVCDTIETMTPESCMSIIVARAGATRVTVNADGQDTN